METRLQVIENHIAQMESVFFKTPIKIPEPMIREEDHIDPRLVQMIHDKHLEGFCGARRVPSDYYERDFEYRRNCLDAQSVDQLTKCVLFQVNDTPDPAQKYVCVVVQYTDKYSSTKINDAISIILKKKVSDVSKAPEEIATKLSGSLHNAMTPAFMNPQPGYEKYKIPVILSQRIASLDPQFFWLGGGEVDVKFGITTLKFMTTYHPYIFDISQ